MDSVTATGHASKIVGRINHVRVVRDSDSRPVWLVALDLASNKKKTLAITDDDVARRMGMDARNPNWRLNSAVPLVFDVRNVEAGLVAVDVQHANMASPPPPAPDATSPDLLLALVRNEARAALSAGMAICRQSSLVPDSAKKLALDDYEAWNKARITLSAERERLAILRALRSLREAAAAGAAASEYTTSLASIALMRVADLCGGALQFMRAARIEAQEGNFDIRRSSAVGRLLDKFPDAARQSAAMVAWAAYFTIRSENRGGALSGILSAIRVSLARAYRSDENTQAEIGAALDSAWKGLSRIQETVRRDLFKHKSIKSALGNVEAAMQWLDVKPTVDSIPQSLPGLDSSEKIALLRDVLEFQKRRHKPAIHVEPDGNGGIRGEFRGGETMHVSRKGVIRVFDSGGKLSIIASQEDGTRHFEKGRPVGEDEIDAAVGVTGPSYCM